MQVGCGFRIMVVKNREYVYFWHYEDRDGRSRQVYRYLGPKASARTARRLDAALDGYYARSAEVLQKELARHRAAAAALRGGRTQVSS